LYVVWRFGGDQPYLRLPPTFSQPLKCLSKPHSADHFFCPSRRLGAIPTHDRWLQRPTGSVKAYTHPPALPGAIVAPLLCCTLATHLHACGPRINTADGVGSTWPSCSFIAVCETVRRCTSCRTKAQLPRCPSATPCHAFTRVSSWLSQFDCVALQSHVCAYVASTRCVWCSPRRDEDQWSHHVSESQ
jgi:hypothetical protein